MGRDNHLLEIPGKKLHPMIAAQKWTSFLWFSKEPGRLPCCWVALCHFAHCLDCLSRSVTSEIFCGTPSAWQTSGCDHCLFTFSHNKMGTNYEDCFSSPCSSFKFLVLCPVTPPPDCYTSTTSLRVSSTGVWTGWTSFGWFTAWQSWLGAKQAFIQPLHTWIAAVCRPCVMY